MFKKVLAVTLSASLTGCGGMMAKKVPTYDPGATPQSQAATFIGAQSPKLAADVKKVFISECNVLFGETTAASAGTSTGMFESGAGQVQKKVSSIYYLKGLTDENMQSMANNICNEAEAKLKAAGYEVVDRSALTANPAYVKMTANGKKSPYEYKVGGNTTYKIFAANGASVFNMAYLGTGGGLKMAMQAASGNAPMFGEGLLVDEYQAASVKINALLDFSEVASNNSKWDKWAGKDRAEVSAKVKFAVNGNIAIVPPSTVKCGKRFGNKECVNNGKFAKFGLKLPVTSDEKFYVSIADATTKGDKIAGAVTGAIGMLAAMAGGHGSAASVSRTNVTVEPTAYEAVAKKAVGNFIDMALHSAKSGS